MTTLTLDKAGRVLIPKSLREELRLGPGDKLHIEAEGEKISLSPVRAKALVKKELGVWVYQGDPSHASVTDIIDREHEKRIREIVG